MASQTKILTFAFFTFVGFSEVLFSPHLTIVACYCHASAQFEFWLFKKVVKPPAEEQLILW